MRRASTMSKARSGGGITSNKYTKSKAGGKVEPRPHAVSVETAAQQGLALGFVRKPLVAGPGYSQGPMPATGVAGYKKPDIAGPGSGRTIYKTGSQMQYGAANPGVRDTAPDVPGASTKGARDILSAYGPERGRR